MKKFFKRIVYIMILKSILRYVFARLREASTWRALILLVGGTWALHNKAQADMLVEYLLVAAGFFGVILPDSLGNYLGSKISTIGEPEPLEPIVLIGRTETTDDSLEPIVLGQSKTTDASLEPIVLGRSETTDASHGSISVLNMTEFTHTETNMATTNSGWGDK